MEVNRTYRTDLTDRTDQMDLADWADRFSLRWGPDDSSDCLDLLADGTFLSWTGHFESGRGSYPQGCGKVFNFVG